MNSNSYEIMPNIWIGFNSTANNNSFIKKANIKYIFHINNNDNSNTLVTNLYLKLESSCGKKTFDIFNKTNDYILAYLKEKTGILISSENLDLSAIICCAFLIKYVNIDYIKAITYINSIVYVFKNDTCLLRSLYLYYIHECNNNYKKIAHKNINLCDMTENCSYCNDLKK